MAQFVGQLRRVLRSVTGGEAPQRVFVCADIASAPGAADNQNCIALAEDADGLGNPGLIYSDGSTWVVI
jgi:hypothetical protein